MKRLILVIIIIALVLSAGCMEKTFHPVTVKSKYTSIGTCSYSSGTVYWVIGTDGQVYRIASECNSNDRDIALWMKLQPGDSFQTTVTGL